MNEESKNIPQNRKLIAVVTMQKLLVYIRLSGVEL